MGLLPIIQDCVMQGFGCTPGKQIRTRAMEMLPRGVWECFGYPWSLCISTSKFVWGGGFEGLVNTHSEVLE